MSISSHWTANRSPSAEARGAGQPPHLGEIAVGFEKLAGLRGPEQLLVRHRGPEEVGEPARQRERAERLDVPLVRLGLDEEQEVGRDEDARERQPDRGLVPFAAGERAIEGGEVAVHVHLLDRPPERAPEEPPQERPGRIARGGAAVGRRAEEPGPGRLLLGRSRVAVGRKDRTHRLLGRFEVLLQGQRRGEQRVAGRVEALAAGPVRRQGPAGLHVQAQQVAHGVRVLVAIEPAAHHAALVEIHRAVARQLRAIDRTRLELARPGDQLAAPAGRHLAGLLRGHLVGSDALEDAGPDLRGVHDRLEVLELRQVQAPLRLLRPVALEAVSLQHRADLAGELLLVFLRDGQQHSEDQASKHGGSTSLSPGSSIVRGRGFLTGSMIYFPGVFVCPLGSRRHSGT